jgi:tetratricopeptide (TPR) repeat protein
LANRQALAYLREAVRLSPSYGEAWGALAFVYRVAISNEAPERTAGFEERLSEAVRQAEKYDPGNGDAAAAMLPADLPFGRWSEFEAIYRSAIQRHPGHGAAYSLLGSLMMETGRWSDAVAVLKAAKARSPSAPLLRYRLITALWSAGRITDAEQEIDLAMRSWPQHGAIWQTKIKLLALTGRSREALALANDTAAKPLDQPSTQNHSGRLLFLEALATGTRVDVEKALESIRSAARSNQLDRVNIAVQASVLGDPGLALDLLEGAYLERGEWRTGQSARDWVSTHPLFQPHARRLWPEPRFEAILTAVGLEQYWRRAKVVPDYRRAA